MHMPRICIPNIILYSLFIKYFKFYIKFFYLYMCCICTNLAGLEAEHGHKVELKVLTPLNFLTTPSFSMTLLNCHPHTEQRKSWVHDVKGLPVTCSASHPAQYHRTAATFHLHMVYYLVFCSPYSNDVSTPLLLALHRATSAYPRVPPSFSKENLPKYPDSHDIRASTRTIP